MNTLHRQCKQHIRSFIRQHWSDQRLAEVYAFCADGKMRSSAPCHCLMGVTTAIQLHDTFVTICPENKLGEPSHYTTARRLAGGVNAERAYIELCYKVPIGQNSQAVADRILRAIMKAEMRRRAQIDSGMVGSLTHEEVAV